VVFSDAAAAWGGPARAEAAAGAFCEAVVAVRRRAGLPGLAIAWGPWAAHTGPAGRSGGDHPVGTDGPRAGVLSTERGLALLDAAQRLACRQLVAVDLDPRALAGRPVRSLPAALRALTAGTASRRPARPTAASASRAAGWAGRLAALAPTERYRVVLTLVRDHAATVLGQVNPEVLRVDVPFKSLGFDSVTAVELRDRLVAVTGRRLPAAVVFKHPTLEALARALQQKLCPDDAAADGQVAGRKPAGGEATNPILDDLARLEKTLAGTGPVDAGLHAVAARLETALAAWKAMAAPDRTPVRPRDTADKLQSATVDQILDFIDNELGVPSDAPPRPAR
jgi:hypothetical protein